MEFKISEDVHLEDISHDLTSSIIMLEVRSCDMSSRSTVSSVSF